MRYLNTGWLANKGRYVSVQVKTMRAWWGGGEEVVGGGEMALSRRNRSHCRPARSRAVTASEDPLLLYLLRKYFHTYYNCIYTSFESSVRSLRLETNRLVDIDVVNVQSTTTLSFSYSAYFSDILNK